MALTVSALLRSLLPSTLLPAVYDALVKEWYRNANQMAALFANYNPYFESRETRNMLLNHLDLTREEIEHQVKGEYEQSIDVFRDVEQQALAMADYFARGLLAR